MSNCAGAHISAGHSSLPDSESELLSELEEPELEDEPELLLDPDPLLLLSLNRDGLGSLPTTSMILCSERWKSEKNTTNKYLEVNVILQVNPMKVSSSMCTNGKKLCLMDE